VKLYRLGPCLNDATYIKLSGIIFEDKNKNCVQDANEIGLKNQSISFNSTPVNYTYSDSSGSYSSYLTRNNYTIRQLIDTSKLPKTKQVCPTSSINMTSINGVQNYPNLNFGDTIQFACQDLKSSIFNLTPLTPGFMNIKAIAYSNLGSNTVANVSLKYRYNSANVLTNGTSSPYTNNGDNITWNIGTLPAFSSGIKYAFFYTKTTATLGSIHLDTAWISPNTSSDCNLANNTSINTDTCIGAYDPNDKIAYPANYIDSSNLFLEYIIRFQNTGNAPAHNVVIKDDLDQFLIPSSLNLLSSSHPCKMYYNENRNIYFEFNNIMLPDSHTNYEKSQGYVRFLTKRIHNLQVGTSIKNKASIYFDYNEPVITNTTVNTLIKLTNANSSINNSNEEDEIFVYPNPVLNEKLIIVVNSTKHKKYDCRIFDLNGRLVYEKNCDLSKNRQIELELNKFTHGLYYLNLSNEDSNYSHVFEIR
jgi:uncharacterized repeat protein (TIGR01451 family)